MHIYIYICKGLPFIYPFIYPDIGLNPMLLVQNLVVQ